MRLNMWMIANCLAVLEPELYLKEFEPAVIKGVRFYSADGYAYVCQRGDKVMCSFEEEYFLLSGLSLEVACGLIQDVFDVFDAWESKVTRWDAAQGIPKDCGFLPCLFAKSAGFAGRQLQSDGFKRAIRPGRCGWRVEISKRKRFQFY